MKMASSDDEDQEINVDDNSQSSGSFYNNQADGNDNQDRISSGRRESDSEATDFDRSPSPLYYNKSPFYNDEIKPDRSRSTSPVETSSAGSMLPFSISRLLSEKVRCDENLDGSDRMDPLAFYHSQLNPLQTARLPGLFYGAGGGVIRVPAHRPGGPGMPPGMPGCPMPGGLGTPFPWLAAMDPAFQRSAAAAAFASQVVKERLTGELFS